MIDGRRWVGDDRWNSNMVLMGGVRDKGGGVMKGGMYV